MTQAEALLHLEHFRATLQKVRSNCAETTGYALDDKGLKLAFPWLFGDYCPLSALVQVLDRDSVTPTEFYNFMVIAESFLPEVSAIVKITTNSPLPKPNLNLINEFVQE